MKVKIKTKICFTLAVLFSLTAHGQASGGESGGGGGTVYGPNGAILIDFLNMDPNFKDTKSYKGWSASRIKNTALKMEIKTENISKVRADNDAFDLALSIIDKWEIKLFSLLPGEIRSAFMAPLTWNFTNKYLTAPNSYLPFPLSSRENIKIAGYYQKADRQYSVQLSTAVWNDLGIFSQAGLLIHESLRHIQIGWSEHFDEESLQKATALLIFCEPDNMINLYLLYVTKNRPDLAEKLIGNFDFVTKKYCRKTL